MSDKFCLSQTQNSQILQNKKIKKVESEQSYTNHFKTNILLPNQEKVNFTIQSFFGLVWAESFNKNRQFLIASIGKPTYPANEYIIDGQLQYWNAMKKSNKSIQYGYSYGELKYRTLVAQALSNQYQLNEKDQYNSSDVVFTVGGIGALRAAYYAIQKIYGNKKILITRPYYINHREKVFEFYNQQIYNPLQFIDLFESGSLTLNASVLEKAMSHLKDEDIATFVLCDPSNPCGTTPSVKEWKQISKILQRYPKSLILLDEAYRQMIFDKQCQSLITISPHLLQRIVLLRSATKGLSVAGERMAVLLSKNTKFLYWVGELVCRQNICIPISAQHGYSYALTHIKGDYSGLSEFYKQRVQFMMGKLIEIDAFPKNIKYHPNSTFYILADLCKMKGIQLDEQSKKVLIENNTGKIQTDVDACIYILYRHSIALCPMSFMGINPKKIMVRISCADQNEEMMKIINAIKSEFTK